MKRLAMAVLFCVVGGVVAGGYWYSQRSASGMSADGKGKGGRGQALSVRAARAVVKPMPVLIEAVGNVEPEQTVQMRAQVSGVLQSILIKEGDRVKAGQLLFEIDPRTYQAQLNQAVAALARDRAQLENAKVQQERLEPLLKREFITRQEYDVAVTSTKSLEATVEADKATVDQARIQLEYARVHAPISGRTGTLSFKVGNLITAGGAGNNLVTINSMDPILVTFSIPERLLDDIRSYQDKGMRIEIVPGLGGPAVAEGRLVFVDNTVTPQTGTVLLKTRVSNAQELLWPGQFVNVRIVLTVEPEAIVVPERAVQPGQDGSFVYLVDAESKVRVQPVKVSRQIGGEVVLASGVKAGDAVLIQIPQALTPGALVQITDGDDADRHGGKGRQGGDQKGSKAEGKQP